MTWHGDHMTWHGDHMTWHGDQKTLGRHYAPTDSPASIEPSRLSREIRALRRWSHAQADEVSAGELRLAFELGMPEELSPHLAQEQLPGCESPLTPAICWVLASALTESGSKAPESGPLRCNMRRLFFT